MASTYSPNLRIELIGYGKQNNTWGTTTNTNLGTLIEQAIAGQAAVNVTAGNVTLTAVDGGTDQSRQMILGITGTPGVARTVTAPSVSKVYVVANGSNAAVTIKMATGTGVVVSSGKAKFVYCNGTDFYEATTEQASAAITNLTVSGNTILGDASADTVTINGTIQPGVVISGSSSSPVDALRITQTGTGNALSVEDSTNPDSSPFVVNTNGDMIVGNTATTAVLGYTQGAQFYRSSGTIAQFRYSADSGSPESVTAKARGSQASPTSVQANDGVWLGRFSGYDGTSFVETARITVAIDGTPGTNDMPGRFNFGTTLDGQSTPTTRFTIDNAGNLYGTAGTTSMTGGFFYIPAAAGAPSGVPTSLSNRVPMYYDTTNNDFYVYNGAWKKVLLG